MSTDLQIVRDPPKTKPEIPCGLTAPHLRWQRRSNGWVAYWTAAPELVRRGYAPKSATLWRGAEPTLEDCRFIASECRRYESQMRTWKANIRHGGAALELGRDPEDPGPGDGWRPTLVPPRSVDWDLVPLSMDAWLERELPPPDFIMGEWLTTTSRAVLNAPTGLGKTNFTLALCAHIAAGQDFLHWRGRRPANVLFLDGEMSRRLLKRRAQDVARRLGFNPSGLYLLSREDISDFPPLNTPGGIAFLNSAIDHLGSVDLIAFDNIMSLIAGDMKDPKAWQQTLPLVSSLTKRAVGQFWVHHTGHDTSRGYGDKTREWEMDVVLHLTEAKRADTDVSFELTFLKARERTPETRRDFQDVTIALVEDQWTCSAVTARRSKPSPLGSKFLEALQDALAGGEAIPFQSWNAIKEDLWVAECARRGLIDLAKRPNARSLVSKYKRELIAHNLIGCHNDLVWPR
jgi:hypothetical protein